MRGSQMIVAGMGFRANALETSLRSALDAAMAQCGQPVQLGGLATAQDKAGAPAFLQLAHSLGLPVFAIAPARLALQAARPSSHVPIRYGRRSVAESSALAAAAAPHAGLLAGRTVSEDRLATAAIAISTTKNTEI